MARADASVQVQLKRKDGAAADGTVRLKKGETTLSCTTQGGTCVIPKAPGGLYAVEADVPGATSKTKSVMIPPSGDVKLIVAVE